MKKPASRKILLASQSPRRKELLAGLGYEFETIAVECDEVYPENLEVSEIAVYLAELKADAFGKPEAGQLLITADTIVAVDGSVLGKPTDDADAVKMLITLSDRNHQVYTGICVRTDEENISFTDVANVFFDKISEAEAKFYVENYHPHDKAGSYGVQDWLGMAKIRKIEGSFYTVMGLPTHKLYNVLSNFE